MTTTLLFEVEGSESLESISTGSGLLDAVFLLLFELVVPVEGVVSNFLDPAIAMGLGLILASAFGPGKRIWNLFCSLKRGASYIHPRCHVLPSNRHKYRQICLVSYR